MSGVTQGSSNHRRRKITNNVMTGVAYACTLAALVPLAAILAQTAYEGARAWDVEFFTGLPSTFGDGGGVSNAIVGSGIILGFAILMAVPAGILSGLYLAEFGDNRLGNGLRFVADVMTGAPSIVIGLVVAVLLANTLGTTAIFGSIAIAILMLPVITRSTEEIVRLVPGDLREASLALGIPRWKTTLRVVVPTALSGIVTGVLLSTARAAGETAPILFVVGTNDFMNTNPFDGPMATLPTVIFEQSSYSEEVVTNAWGAALLLLVIVVVLNLIARLAFRGRSVR